MISTIVVSLCPPITQERYGFQANLSKEITECFGYSFAIRIIDYVKNSYFLLQEFN